jgi:hypothetical protein
LFSESQRRRTSLWFCAAARPAGFSSRRRRTARSCSRLVKWRSSWPGVVMGPRGRGIGGSLCGGRGWIPETEHAASPLAYSMTRGRIAGGSTKAGVCKRRFPRPGYHAAAFWGWQTAVLACRFLSHARHPRPVGRQVARRCINTYRGMICEEKVAGQPSRSWPATLLLRRGLSHPLTLATVLNHRGQRELFSKSQRCRLTLCPCAAAPPPAGQAGGAGQRASSPGW